MNIKINKLFFPLVFFLILLIGWEFISRMSSTLTFVLPPPSMILKTFFFKIDQFAFHSFITLKEMIGGITIAFCFAFPLAWVMYLSLKARYILQPTFLIIQCIPMFTLAPIMVIWFGWSYISIVIPTALMIFFPLTINIFEGLKATPSEYLDYFKVNKATSWQLFTKLQLPWAFPQICAGLRISAAIAGIGAVAGEWAGGQNGLGIVMLESRRAADLVTCFASLFCLTLLSMSFYLAVLLYEKISIKKHKNFSALCVAMGMICLSVFIPLFFGESPKNNKQLNLVLDWLPNPDHVPLYVGLNQGFFKSNGVDLRIRKMPDPSDSIAYLSSGQADLAVYYMPDTIQINAQGANFKVVGKLIDKPLRGLIFRSDSNIYSYSDLNNKIAGYCVDGTCMKCLEAILETNNIDATNFVNISYDLVTALVNKQVDYTYGAFWNIECEQLKSLGIDTSYFSIEELGVPNYSELILITSEGSVLDHGEKIEQIQKAMQESIEFCVSHPHEAFEMYIKANPDKSEATRNWEWEAWLKTVPLLAKNQILDLNEWNQLKNWLIEKNVISLDE